MTKQRIMVLILHNLKKKMVKVIQYLDIYYHIPLFLKCALMG